MPSFETLARADHEHK